MSRRSKSPSSVYRNPSFARHAHSHRPVLAVELAQWFALISDDREDLLPIRAARARGSRATGAGGRRAAAGLARRAGLYNVIWSLTGATGFFFSGSLFTLDPDAVFWVPLAAHVLMLAVLAATTLSSPHTRSSEAVAESAAAVADYTLDPQAAARAISPRTAAIMPVNVFGCPPDYEALGQLARDRGVRLMIPSTICAAEVAGA